MANTIKIIRRIQLRRDTPTNWTTLNPILADGEPGFERITRRVKVGDGVTPWNDLPYQGSGGSDASFEFVQAQPADTWTINHNLGKFPSVTIVDTAGDEVEGNVNHISNTQVVLSFSAAFSGRAFLN